MSRIMCAILIAVILGLVAFFIVTGTGLAQSRSACPTWKAERDVRQARLAYRKANQRLAEAKRILTATRAYSARYGSSVGRWSRLARHVGWPWSQFSTLFSVMDRESGGDPCAKNPCSSASGLMQLMSCHWAGRFDPFDPRANLAYSLKLWRQEGWSPWEP